MRSLAVLATASVLALTGCTQSGSSPTSGFEGAEKAVAQKVADLADAGQRREAADICGSVVSEALRKRIEAADSTCNAEMQRAIEDADNFELDVDDVKITGNTATAVVTGTDQGEETRRTFEFVREEGGWRIESFG